MWAHRIGRCTLSGLVEQVRLRRRLPPLLMRKAIREAAGLSQAALAREVGVDRVTVARWEAGRRTPRSRYLEAYVGVLEALRSEVEEWARKS